MTRHRLFIALSLLGVFAGTVLLFLVGWLIGVSDVAVAAAVVSNVGTLVAAVIAFYFADPGKDSN